jgi:molybdopterin converting factor small subunit
MADKQEHLSIVKFATIGEEVKEIAFDAVNMPLPEAAEKADMSLDNCQVRLVRGGKRTMVKNPDKLLVRHNDVVFLIPPVNGG